MVGTSSASISSEWGKLVNTRRTFAMQTVLSRPLTQLSRSYATAASHNVKLAGIVGESPSGPISTREPHPSVQAPDKWVWALL
jgi:hypothetical protein